MTPQKQRSTFISYSRVNKEFAIRLALELRSVGFEIWLDQLDIPPGARWDDEVEMALESCEIFMVILTPASMASDNVKDEIGYAIDTRKRILPILLENATIPLRLRRLQYVDFTSKGFDDGVEAAKQLLKRLVDEPTLPNLQIPASFRAQGTELNQELQAQIERLAVQQAETERKEKEEAELLEREQAEEERIRKAELEAQWLAAEKAKTERKAKEESERLAAQKAEEEQQAKEKAERLAAQKAEEERIRQAGLEAQRLAAEKEEAERKVKEEAERLAAQKVEEDRLAKIEKERKAKEEAERLAAQHLAAEKAEAERITSEKAEADRVAKERKEAERLAALKAIEERKAREEADKVASRKALEEQRALERQELEKQRPQTAASLQEHAPPAKKSRTLLFVGIGAGTLVILAIFALVAGILFLKPGTPKTTVAASVTTEPTIKAIEDDSIPVSGDSTATVVAPTATKRPTPTPKPSSTKIPEFFTEQFEEDTSNWSYFNVLGSNNTDESALTLETNDGYMVFDIATKQLYTYVTFDPYTYADVAIELSADNRGSNNNAISLICRYSDEGWYEVNVQNNGLYNILVASYNADGNINYARLADGGSNEIKAGENNNSYKLICKGRTISLYINGVETRTLDDNQYVLRDGQVGFSVSSFDDPTVKVDVDWVKISKP